MDRRRSGAGRAADADIALCTAERLDEADAAVAGGEVAVLSLDPFGRPAPDLPIGVTDYATAVRVHGDQIVAERDPGPALAGRSADEMLAACQSPSAARGLTSTDRVLSTASLAMADDLVDGLLACCAVGGVAGAGGQRRPRHADAQNRDRKSHPGAVTARGARRAGVQYI